jgi:hypothetical protein
MKLDLQRLAFRAWYYFRIGYGTYLTFLLGFVTTIVTVYYLAINNIPALKVVFTSFTVFGIISIATGVPICIVAGYVHFKRSLAYSSEADIAVEANPYYYKVLPGKEAEVSIPWQITSIDLTLAVARRLEVLTPEVEREYVRIRQLLVNLKEHGDYRKGPRDSQSRA